MSAEDDRAFERFADDLARETEQARKDALRAIVDAFQDHDPDWPDAIPAIAETLMALVAATANATMAALPRGWTKR